jgi:hypothetical protein
MAEQTASQESVKGGNAQGGNVQGGSTQGGNVQGGSAQGGTTPVPAQEAGSEGFVDSVLQILAENIGAYIVAEFLVGTNTIVGRQGILEFVGPNYIVLHDEANQIHIIGDAAALRFVSICFGEEGENGATASQTATQQTQQGAQTPTPAPSPTTPSGVQMVSANARAHSQAAFNYAKRKTRR